MYKELTIQEAVDCGKFATYSMSRKGDAIFREGLRVYAEDKKDWAFIFAITAVYNAGRINGIRAERAKRRGETI